MNARLPIRLKASLERVQRMTQSFTDSLLEVLPNMADSLGNALGIEEERQQVSVVSLHITCVSSVRSVQPSTASDAGHTIVTPAAGSLLQQARCCWAGVYRSGGAGKRSVPAVWLAVYASEGDAPGRGVR